MIPHGPKQEFKVEYNDKIVSYTRQRTYNDYLRHFKWIKYKEPAEPNPYENTMLSHKEWRMVITAMEQALFIINPPNRKRSPEIEYNILWPIYLKHMRERFPRFASETEESLKKAFMLL